jgi:hypothetical protein
MGLFLTAALIAALTETPAATLTVTPTATFAVKPHVYKASTTLAR